MPLQHYRELTVWQKAIDLVVLVYEVTKRFPDDERFGMISQMRRAAVSIPANIAEGYGRRHRGDYLRFVSISQGSVCELETLMILSGRLRFVSREELAQPWRLAQEVGKMLRALHNALKDTDRGLTNP
jgi:four helix bundle protein